ncbi:hypothetical protein RMSM_01156 [Rhodopirellula maiorica SM1]|uniref:Uncharacterized protein n=1 Tax=Rhodopirellula maiorica SM1 TaxID=1265738 RepID=M5RRE9_9BACT|nr:hypothetical protein [Rhodopirellula maiorica]EMI21913.1 hypothetical protein RMSM_01156 [Rhodopirellula maiorica SM1]
MRIYSLVNELLFQAGSADIQDGVVGEPIRGAASGETGTCTVGNRRLAIVLCLVTTLVGFAIGGCSDDSAAKEILLKRGCLSELASQYRDFQTEHGKSPEDVTEFAAFIKASMTPEQDPATTPSADGPTDITTEAYRRLTEGDMMMLYDAVLFTDPAVDPTAILGFEAAVAGSGGYVVAVNGDATHLSARTFAQHAKVATVEKAPSN